MNLQIETLEQVEAPLTDMEWGMIGGAALIAGYYIGAAIVT
ncbi:MULTISPECIES: hypothetical protein [unclassified Massilia]|nr:hypothetical protein [Massilia sp. ST3]